MTCRLAFFYFDRFRTFLFETGPTESEHSLSEGCKDFVHAMYLPV